MLSVDAYGVPIHYPQTPDKFVFDAEVSEVFPDMARRSIPGYAEAHRLHISLLADVFGQSSVTVCDIGASRGAFFAEICNQFQIDPAEGSPRFNFIAVDSSEPMLRLLKRDMPWVNTIRADAVGLADLQEPVDVISLFYVLQFIKEDSDKLGVLKWAHRNLRDNGVLLLGQKDRVPPPCEERFTSEYYRFRLRNGYTLEEIDAKTRALANSMWPITQGWLEALVYEAKFREYAITTQWLQFSTSLCLK